MGVVQVCLVTQHSQGWISFIFREFLTQQTSVQTSRCTGWCSHIVKLNVFTNSMMVYFRFLNIMSQISILKFELKKIFRFKALFASVKMQLFTQLAALV